MAMPRETIICVIYKIFQEKGTFPNKLIKQT